MNLKTYAKVSKLLLAFSILFLFSCNNQKKEKDPTVEEESTVLNEEWLKNILLTTKEKSKRKEKIMLLRKKLMLLMNSGNSECNQNTLKHEDPNRPRSGTFTDIARQCDLEQDFNYRVMIKNNLRWQSKTVFLYEGESLFFAYQYSGAIDSPIEQRLYFDEEENVISIIENTNPIGRDMRTTISEQVSSYRADAILDEMYDNLNYFEDIMRN